MCSELVSSPSLSFSRREVGAQHPCERRMRGTSG